MIALLLLLLALVPHSSALPLLTKEKDNQLLAEVRSSVPISNVSHSCKLSSTHILYVYLHRGRRVKTYFFMLLRWSLFSFLNRNTFNASMDFQQVFVVDSQSHQSPFRPHSRRCRNSSTSRWPHEEKYKIISSPVVCFKLFMSFYWEIDRISVYIKTLLYSDSW